MSAPGVNIYSTTPTYHVPINDPPYNMSLYYDRASGTSAAAPYVSGVAALIWSKYPNMTRDDVRYQLRFTANDLGDEGFDKNYGWGRINARKAVEEAKPEHDLAIIDFQMPYVTPPNETVHVKTTVLNFGLLDEYNVSVVLRINGNRVNGTQVSMLRSGATAASDLSWTPTATGEVMMQSVVVAATGETRTANNIATTKLLVRYPTVLKVPQNYPTIQSAIVEALPLDTIEVSNGTYYEHLTVNKSIKIIGQGRDTTIIDGSGSGTIITIVEDGVTISGFTIQNSGPDYYSIVITSNGNNITGNRVKNGLEGIYLWGSSNNTIHGNIVTQMYDAAIFLYPGSGNDISQNDISANYFGIFTLGGEGNKIHKNRIVSNLGDGIFAHGDYGNEIFDNKIASNNGCGIYSFGGQKAKIEGNFIKSNNYGLYLIQVADWKIYRNSFVNNTSQAYVEASTIQWSGDWNVTGNYWSDYNGTDSDGNGVGDTAHDIYSGHKDQNPLMNPYLPGDVNNDGKVDGKDIAIVAKYYGSIVTSESPNLAKRADLDEDGDVDDADLDIPVANFGKTWQKYWGE